MVGLCNWGPCSRGRAICILDFLIAFEDERPDMSADNNKKAPPWAFSHVGLYVRDLDRMAAFYLQAFSMVETGTL